MTGHLTQAAAHERQLDLLRSAQRPRRPASGRQHRRFGRLPKLRRLRHAPAR